MTLTRWLCSAIVVVAASFGTLPVSRALASEDLMDWIEQNAGAEKYTPEDVMQMQPPGPNPWLSLRPLDAQVNWSYWSTRGTAEQFITPPNIMDQGGNLANTVGVGPDGIFGTADDADVDFGLDIFVPSEGFTGFEDTLNSIAVGDPAPKSKK